MENKSTTFILIMNKYFYIILFSFSLSSSFSQNTNFVPKSDSNKNNAIEEMIFREIEMGIKNSNVNEISKYFGSQTYFSFSNGINGYYSTNQAFYVLEDFFKLYKVTSFRLSNIKIDKAYAYATGKYNYDNKGQRSSAQVYISIKKIGNNWNITQFTIN